MRMLKLETCNMPNTTIETRASYKQFWADPDAKAQADVNTDAGSTIRVTNAQAPLHATATMHQVMLQLYVYM